MDESLGNVRLSNKDEQVSVTDPWGKGRVDQKSRHCGLQEVFSKTLNGFYRAVRSSAISPRKRRSMKHDVIGV